jgi:2-aminoethylphosphonate-pyruvate transaminase
MSTGVGVGHGNGEREVLLNPGPVNVSDRVRAALGRGDLCHREPEFAKLMTNVRRKLEALFAPPGGGGAGSSHAAVLIAGSGTSAVEAMVGSAVAPGRKLAVVTNGVYGERIADIARRHGTETVTVGSQGDLRAWTRIPSRQDVERALDDPLVETLACVHHETTTGLLNPIREWAAAAKERGKTVVLDSVSGLAGEELELDAWSIDAVAGTANKCIQGIPGSSFVLVKKATLERWKTYPQKTLYFDLGKNLDAQEKGYPAFTQPVQVLFAFEAALEELEEETVRGRVARMKRASALLREGFRELGLELLLPEAVRSNTITTLALPPGMSYPTLHDLLKARGFVIYAGQGGLEKTVFRVANMGALGEHDFRAFLAALTASLRPAGARA